jgi:hypothetical protein
MRALTKLPGYLLALTWMLFFACNDATSKRTISLDEIRPTSTQKSNQKDPENAADTLQRLLNFYANDSASLQIAHIELNDTNDKFFLDRFSLTRQRYLLTDSLQKDFQYSTWFFKDSNSCTEAFYNWLDQAGKNKTSVALRTGNIWSSSHDIYVVADRQILKISSTQPIHLKKWLNWYSGTPEFTTFKYIIYAQPKQKTKWLQHTNSKSKAL